MPAGWAEYLLRGRYIDPRKLVSHLETKFGALNYRLSTQRDFYIIHTPQPLSPAQKQEIEKASSLKFAPPPKRLSPIRLKGSQGRRGRSPKDAPTIPDPGQRKTDAKGNLLPLGRSATAVSRTSSNSKWSLAKLGIFSRTAIAWRKVGQQSKAADTVKSESSEASNVQS